MLKLGFKEAHRFLRHTATKVNKEVVVDIPIVNITVDNLMAIHKPIVKDNYLSKEAYPKVLVLRVN